MDRRVVGVLGAVGVFAVLLRVHPGGALVGRAVDDVGQLVAAGLACAACAWRAMRSPRSLAWSWWLLAAATGCWAAGETAWSYFELVAGRQTPFPSLADAGFLLFPALAVAGLLCWPSGALVGAARWRALLDGAMVAGALFILSWVTALGSAVHASADSAFGQMVSVGYPVSDLVLLTLTLVILGHARQAAGTGLGLLAAAIGCLCLADSGFAYLTAIGRYATGSPVDVGWFGGFLLIAAAAVTAHAAPSQRPDAAAAAQSGPRALLTYVPAGLGLTVAAGGQLTGSGDRSALLGATLVMAALLGRQLLALRDNHQLLAKLTDAQRSLHYQAFHDPLTGLANRALFGDRLRHGLELHRRDLRPLSLLYCDLDGFKTVNDTLGHDAGDEVLKAVAERLRAVIRTGDTIARLGGDEFAVLLEDGADPAAVAAKILDAFTAPAVVGQHRVPLGGSIGIAELTPSQGTVSPELLLRRADTAMYHAKRHGKGTALHWTPQLDQRPQQAEHALVSQPASAATASPGPASPARTAPG